MRVHLRNSFLIASLVIALLLLLHISHPYPPSLNGQDRIPYDTRNETIWKSMKRQHFLLRSGETELYPTWLFYIVMDTQSNESLELILFSLLNDAGLDPARLVLITADPLEKCQKYELLHCLPHRVVKGQYSDGIKQTLERFPKLKAFVLLDPTVQISLDSIIYFDTLSRALFQKDETLDVLGIAGWHPFSTSSLVDIRPDGLLRGHPSCLGGFAMRREIFLRLLERSPTLSINRLIEFEWFLPKAVGAWMKELNEIQAAHELDFIYPMIARTKPIQSPMNSANIWTGEALPGVKGRIPWIDPSFSDYTRILIRNISVLTNKTKYQNQLQNWIASIPQSNIVTWPQMLQIAKSNVHPRQGSPLLAHLNISHLPALQPEYLIVCDMCDLHGRWDNTLDVFRGSGFRSILGDGANGWGLVFPVESHSLPLPTQFMASLSLWLGGKWCLLVASKSPLLSALPSDIVKRLPSNVIDSVLDKNVQVVLSDMGESCRAACRRLAREEGLSHSIHDTALTSLLRSCSHDIIPYWQKNSTAIRLTSSILYPTHQSNWTCQELAVTGLDSTVLPGLVYDQDKKTWILYSSSSSAKTRDTARHVFVKRQCVCRKPLPWET